MKKHLLELEKAVEYQLGFIEGLRYKDKEVIKKEKWTEIERLKDKIRKLSNTISCQSRQIEIMEMDSHKKIIRNVYEDNIIYLGNDTSTLDITLLNVHGNNDIRIKCKEKPVVNVKFYTSHGYDALKVNNENYHYRTYFDYDNPGKMGEFYFIERIYGDRNEKDYHFNDKQTKNTNK